MDERRVRFILKKEKKGPIVYWMSRDQRIKDNWALTYAQELAIKKRQPLIVIFCLQSKFVEAESRIFDFMLNGLEILENNLEKLKIKLVVLTGRPEIVLTKFVESFNIGMVITDFSPLKIKREWIDELKNQLKITFCEVDTHNIIPCWFSSEKKEYAAYTIRTKIKKLLNEFLVEFPKLKQNPYSWNEELSDNDWIKLRKLLRLNESKYKIDWIKPGEEEAWRVLNDFIQKKFKSYVKDRNDPNKNAVSNLSPYLHFGHIASQRVVLEAIKTRKLSELKGSFYDEIIVRKELSDNYCYYCPDYDNFEGFHPWARKTLNEHRKDKREYVYSLEEFESAQTHDDLWNAAQIQMVKIGKMHGYLRMYWGKKMLEWTETPEEALRLAIYLNDKYELDGRDPNGYTGIAWSIGGVHDRAWGERKIFGKIRYMSYNGMKRKFNIKEYIEKFVN